MEKKQNNTGMQENLESNLEDNISRIKHKLIVISGKGGVGKSTVSVNLAYGLASSGFKVGILDVDIHGPSIAKMLGIEGRTLTVPEGKKRPGPVKVSENMFALSIAFLIANPDEPIVWRGPLKMGAIKQFLQDIEWPELDFLIIDSPPGTGDEPLSVIQLIKDLSGSIIVSTPQDVALLDARKTIKFSQKLHVPVLGIIENMGKFTCPHCGEAIDIFKGLGVEKAAKDFNIEILGKIPIDMKISEMGDKGGSFIDVYRETDSAREMKKIVNRIIEKL